MAEAQRPCKHRRRNRIAAGLQDGHENNNSKAYIPQSCQAARALRHSMVTVTFVTWSKLQPPAWLLASGGLSTSCELRHRPLCLTRTLRLLHIACLLDSCRLQKVPQNYLCACAVHSNRWMVNDSNKEPFQLGQNRFTCLALYRWQQNVTFSPTYCSNTCCGPAKPGRSQSISGC